MPSTCCTVTGSSTCPPAEVWTTLLDEGVYLGSQSTFYRLLRHAGEPTSVLGGVLTRYPRPGAATELRESCAIADQDWKVGGAARVAKTTTAVVTDEFRW